MALIYNGTSVERVIYNGVELDKIIYNGVTVFDSLFDITSTLTGSRANFNLATYAQSLGWSPSSGKRVSGVVTLSGDIYSSNPNNEAFAFNLEDFPEGSDITLRILSGAYIVGAGGAGGSSTNSGSLSGQPGGDAIYLRGLNALGKVTFRIDNRGWIGGGGGGGGSGGGSPPGAPGGTNHRWGGGGGAGKIVGQGGSASGGTVNYPGTAGTLTAGGAGGANGGKGGGLGEAGLPSSSYYGSPQAPGGSAGSAVFGDRFVSWINIGTIYGSRVT